MARPPAELAINLWASPVTFIAILIRGQCRCTASLTRSGSSTSTVNTRTPSSRNEFTDTTDEVGRHTTYPYNADGDQRGIVSTRPVKQVLRSLTLVVEY